jgi:hypothetical protein
VRRFVPSIAFFTAPLAITIAIAIAPRARADAASDAQKLFDEGKSLSAAGDCANALSKFEASQKLDPAVGPLLNMGNCNEQLGRTATAWARFVEAETLARARGDHERELYARRRAAALLPKLVRWTITAPDAAPGLVVLRDGVAVDASAFGVPVPIDPGEHVVEANAPGRKAFHAVVHANDEGSVIETEIPSLDPVAGDVGVTPERASSIESRRTLMIVTGGLAVGGIAIGAYFGLTARARWKDAQATCTDLGCPDSGQSLAAEARRDAIVSTVSFIVAGASAIATTALYFTLPSTDARVAPATLGGAPGVVVWGSF